MKEGKVAGVGMEAPGLNLFMASDLWPNVYVTPHVVRDFSSVKWWEWKYSSSS